MIEIKDEGETIIINNEHEIVSLFLDKNVDNVTTILFKSGVTLSTKIDMEIIKKALYES